MTRPPWRLTLGAALLAALGGGAAAQEAAPAAGWRFEVAPYVWLPSVDAKLRFGLPPGVGGTTDVRTDASDYATELNFAVAVAGSARLDRFSLLTDLIYANAEAGRSRVEAADIAGVGRSLISRSANSSGRLNLETMLWTLAGGYTLAEGAWGQVEALGGVRYLGIEAKADYGLTVTLFGPRGTAGPSFGGSGQISGREDIWNGIVGLRGRINLGQSGFFLPYYLDIGAGNSNLTWQGFAGVGYQAGWAGVQLGWRYLSYDQGGNSLVQDLALSGGYLAVNFNF
jgi:hypothetical protein